MSEDTPPAKEVAVPAAGAGVPLRIILVSLSLFVAIVSLIALSHWYLGTRLIRDAGLSGPLASALWSLLGVAFASVFGTFLASRLLPRKVAAPLVWLGYLWLGTFGVLLSTTLLSELVVLVLSQLGFGGPQIGPLRALGVVLVSVPALLWGLAVARVPKHKRVEVTVAGLAPAFDGYRLVQLSDVHIGETLGRPFASWLVKQVNALQPDAVVLTGDLVDGSVESLKHEVSPFGELRAKDGVYYVTGNHEYYHGGSSWESELRRLGATVLHNEHTVVSRGDARLIIGGVPDLEGARFAQAHRPSAARAFEGAPEGARVLLAHQPRFAKAAKGHGVGLMLSGHTHAGQLFPIMFFVRLQQPVVKGFHVIDGVPTYTSNGTGYWGPPFRIGTRGEITEVVLKSPHSSR